jgi:hypothetical protein
VKIRGIEDVGSYDSLYVAPSDCSALLSCPGRILAESRQGLELLVVVLFSSTSADGALQETIRALDLLGGDHVRMEMRPARQRHAAHASFASAVHGRYTEDDFAARELLSLLDELRVRTRARSVYLPLGAGGHIDHRLAHEAGLQTFPAGEERNVFLFEERPQVFVPGAVRIRLGQLGARLPPAAADVADGGSFARFLFSLQTAPHLRRELKGLGQRLRCAALAARQWRRARSWRPQKGFGMRLQPVLQTLGLESAETFHQAMGLCESTVRAQLGSRQRLLACDQAHARVLGGSQRVERYWLLLPPSSVEAAMLLPAAG